MIIPTVPKYLIIKEMDSRDVAILIVLAIVVYMIVCTTPELFINLLSSLIIAF